jgi:hypothetical protein
VNDLQVRPRTPLEALTGNLSDLICLPDPDAATALNERMAALDLIHRVHERTYPETGIIAREFERRQLYKYLVDPDTGVPFSTFTAWASCSNFLACRRIIFESKRDMEMLQDVPADKLIDVPKSTIKVMTQLSTAVRNDPGILDAAKTLSPNKFLEKVEREQPLQHLEMRKPLRLNPGRSEAKIIGAWIDYALNHDIAGSPTEAIVRACEVAMHDAELDEELAAIPVEESNVAG